MAKTRFSVQMCQDDYETEVLCYVWADDAEDAHEIATRMVHVLHAPHPTEVKTTTAETATAQT